MYGPLLMLVIFAPLFVVALIVAIVPFHLYEHYEEKRWYTDKYGNKYCFYGSEGDFKRLLEENPAALAKLQKNEKKRNCYKDE